MFLNFSFWREISIRSKNAEGTEKSSVIRKRTISCGDGTVKLPIRCQMAAEQNSDDLVQSRCLGKMKSVPVIVCHCKKPRNLPAQPFMAYASHLLVSAAIWWPFSGMTP